MLADSFGNLISLFFERPRQAFSRYGKPRSHARMRSCLTAIGFPVLENSHETRFMDQNPTWALKTQWCSDYVFFLEAQLSSRIGHRFNTPETGRRHYPASVVNLQPKLNVARSLGGINLAKTWSQARGGRSENRSVREIDKLGPKLNSSLITNREYFLKT